MLALQTGCILPPAPGHAGAAPATASPVYVVLPAITAKCIRLLRHPTVRVAKPALRAVGNVVCADDDRDFTGCAVALGLVPQLRRLIEASGNREMQKEACWTLSNVAAGSSSQVHEVIASGVMQRILATCADPHADTGVRTEACWVLLNSCSCGSDLQLESLVRAGAIRALVGMIRDSTVVSLMVDSLGAWLPCRVLCAGVRLLLASSLALTLAILTILLRLPARVCREDTSSG